MSKLLVWDLPLRLFHWLLALAVLGSWLTHRIGTGAFLWHTYFGYATLTLVLFRIVWGFVGPQHARFTNFVRGPVAMIRHARGLFGAKTERSLGHNPLGALMVLLFLALLLVQAAVGLFANDEIVNSGPMYGLVSDSTSDSLTRLHRQLAEILWVAIGIHVVAVFGYLLLKHENLILPMITGRKDGSRWPGQASIASSRLPLAAAVAAICAALVWYLIRSAPEPALMLF